MSKLSLAERLEKYSVWQASGCRIWTGCLTRDGYGKLFINGSAQLLHRVVFEEEHGPIPSGFDVDHTCWNRGCCSLDHLRLLSASDNRRRQRSALALTCENGHPFAGDNLYIYPTGRRGCRACAAVSARRYRAKKAAA